jgi:Family of unknown function (DUF6236)
MLGSALYFPTIDINDPIWLRSAILFWDEIQTIAPSSIETPYRNFDTSVCFSEGYLRPLRCDLHPGLIEKLAQKVFRALKYDQFEGATVSAQKNSAFESVEEAGLIPSEIEGFIRSEHDSLLHIFNESRGKSLKEIADAQRSRTERKILPIVEGLGYSRVHPSKMSMELGSLFEKILDRGDQEWLMVDERFADAYMSALAAELAQQLHASPLTSQQIAHGLSFRFMFDEMLDSSAESARGAMIAIVMRTLSVDPSVPVEKLIRFRQSRRDQLLDCSSRLLELSTSLQDSGVDSADELFPRAQETYNRSVAPALRALKRELDQQSILTVWEGAYRALTISVPSAGALAYFTGMAGPALLGAGAAIAAADIGVRGYLAGRRIRSSDRFSYLHDVKANFGLPDLEID